jgi:hypothetical protein
MIDLISNRAETLKIISQRSKSSLSISTDKKYQKPIERNAVTIVQNKKIGACF